MSFAFNPDEGLIRVEAVVEGPTGDIRVSLALDTGAVETVIGDSALRLAGFDPSSAAQQVQATAATGVVSVSRLPVKRLSALGQECFDFPVLAHTLPTSAGVDGLLGLDFIRGKTLKIDFRAGLIDLQ
jgi:hypothetical protein